MSRIDYEKFKGTLSQILREDDTFADYDQSGRALSVLLDLLSKDAEILGMYLSMSSNERDVATARLRENVVSALTRSGKTPRITTCPVIEGYIKQPIDDVSPLESVDDAYLPGSVISHDGKTYHTTGHLRPDTFKDGKYSYPFVAYSGKFIRYRINTNGSPFQRFVIERPRIDINSIKAYISEEENITVDDYNHGPYNALDTSTIDIAKYPYTLRWTQKEHIEIIFLKTIPVGLILTFFAVSYPEDYQITNSDTETKARSANLVESTEVVVETDLTGNHKSTTDELRTIGMANVSSDGQLVELEQYLPAILARFGIPYAKVYRTPDRPASVSVVLYNDGSQNESTGLNNTVKHWLEQRNAGSEVIVKDPRVWSIGLSMGFIDAESVDVPEDIRWVNNTGVRILADIDQSDLNDQFSVAALICARSNVNRIKLDYIRVERPDLEEQYYFNFGSISLTNIDAGEFVIPSVYNVGSRIMAVLNGNETIIGELTGSKITLFSGYSTKVDSVLTISDISSDVIRGQFDTLFVFETTRLN